MGSIASWALLPPARYEESLVVDRGCLASRRDGSPLRVFRAPSVN